MRIEIFAAPFSRWGNWALERLSNFLRGNTSMQNGREGLKIKISLSKVYTIKHYIVLLGNICWMSPSSQILKLVMKIQHVNKTGIVHVLWSLYSDLKLVNSMNNCKCTILALFRCWTSAEDKSQELWKHGTCNWVVEDRGMINETSWGEN